VVANRASWWPDWRLAIVALLAAAFAVMFMLPEHVRDVAWTQLGISPLNPPFSDSRAITAAWQCTNQGIDVMVRNPCDPWQRIMQYPKIWMIPAALGFGQDLTNWLGAANAVLSLGTVIWVMGPVRRLWEAGLYLALLLSPPVLLLLERGNVDGLILALVGMSMVLWSAQGTATRALALLLVELAAVLKLFPIITAWALLRRGGRGVMAAVGALTAVFAIYLLATAKEVAQVAPLTQQGIYPAYGVGVLVVAIRHPGVQGGPLLVHVGQGRGDALLRVAVIVAVVGLAALLSWVASRAHLEHLDAGAAPWHLDAYLAGSLIYASSFLLFNNWDYRMAFVLLAMPKLLSWSRAPEPALAWLARGGIVSFVVAALSSRFSPDAALLYGFGQAAKTVLCVLLLGLVFAEIRDRLQRWRPALKATRGRPEAARSGAT
jgi:hypothetical protein